MIEIKTDDMGVKRGYKPRKPGGGRKKRKPLITAGVYEVTIMTKYREILRLQSLGFSERNIAQSCGVSRNTVARVLKKAAEINISWPLDFDMTDSALEELMFPRDKSATNKRMPDFNYIRKELLRNGVNKKLLWVEYCEECRMSNEEPLMYSQFCYYIQKDEEKRRATMHIPRKPGEQIHTCRNGA